MPRFVVLIGLEAYAVLLALMQAGGGIRTDEAKYLLNIPYPHPPTIRWALSQFEMLTNQEFMMRILFATLMVQAVWLVWDMARDLPCSKKLSLAAIWLLSGGLLLQAGTIMMAPLTALEALVFLWMMHKKVRPMWVGLFWLLSLFTAYQAALFLPLVIACMQKQKCSLRMGALYIGVPIALLCLYTLTNPLIPASMISHSNRDLDSSLISRLIATGRLWAIGGSVFLSVFGTWGIVRARRWDLLAAFLLVFLYITFSRYNYYAVLFLPLFVGGILAKPTVFAFPRLNAALSAAVGLNLALGFFSGTSLPTARTAMQLFEGMDLQGVLLIEGSFGHEWQYESPWEVRRFTDGLTEEAGAIVCLSVCPEWDKATWRALQFEPEIWVRSKWLS